ncbi:hypothetical protein HMPREF1574_00774 [Gardnerella pickettii JCP7659]|nr:hypothetical protein HMPREF1583_01495 [Gardnerella vaginalis JCP8151B]EPI55097.1 hypothetical protein HMPREF1574_00774 [Gardnerella pickettii JCP7659]KXA15836.1 hypothetical protein HMPREF3204_00907 [Gardnerella pickettii]
MPVWLKIIGFTTIMYDIAKNVVRPAVISVDTFVPFSLRWKNFSINSLFLGFTAQKTIKSVARALEQSRTQLHLGIHAEVTATRSARKAQAEQTL